MARLRVNEERTAHTKRKYVGDTLLFCEGSTEVNYFEYFAGIINKRASKFSTMKIEFVNAEGNAKRVLDYANEFFENEENARKYVDYDKCLVFDCDAPENIRDVIRDMQSNKNDYSLLLTIELFETWLLMHFEYLTQPLSKKQTYIRLAQALGRVEYTDNDKDDPGIIRQIVEQGDNVGFAIKNAVALYNLHEKQGHRVVEDTDNMNPYTTVHTLMLDVLFEIRQSYEQGQGER